jgi:hypothetical protein
LYLKIEKYYPKYYKYDITANRLLFATESNINSKAPDEGAFLIGF